VSPILGIWASQNYSRYSLPTSFDSIATTTVGAGGSSSVTFSSIPQTYTHLQLRILSLQNTATSGGTISLNSDTTTTNYYYHYISGNGSAASAGAGQDRIYAPWNSGSSSGPGVTILDFIDYANTNKYKTVRQLNGYDTNGAGAVLFTSHLWMNTSAINTIAITSSGFSQYSSFALYGVKGI
jgi:hypothetical protein